MPPSPANLRRGKAVHDRPTAPAAAGGDYPPPPPPAGGYAPPPPGPAIRSLPNQAYTPWLTRVGAYLIDTLPFAVILGAGWLILQNSVDTACLTDIIQYDVDQICDIGYSTLGMAVMWGAVLVGLVYLVWNYGYRQGTTGSSIGKSVLKFKVVSENSGQPMGFGSSLLRQITHWSTPSSSASATSFRSGPPSAKRWPTRSWRRCACRSEQAAPGGTSGYELR